jgi:hypothetical protein
MIVETMTVHREVTNKKTEIVCNEIRPIKVKFFWDAHGKMIPWELDGKSELPRQEARVELRRETYTEFGTDWSDMHLYIDGKRIPGTLRSLTSAGLAKVTVGWG